ncbi:MAG: type II toxin-antitoxin system RelE/ParE family toxin [Candidatus Nomurabacteria bacterium]|jgi:mRNA interferase RelE/StbE|nr:type II toxin-antitoxin system RelE/ParE family toxin [Candidatus Nomurabacteria bacterium]
MYKIEFTSYATRKFKKLPKDAQVKILPEIEQLATNPRPIAAKKLVGRSGWRLRIENYRVIYEILDEILLIEVVEVGHRREVYR